MAVEAQPARHLPWDACYNVRDLGGYTTVDGAETRWRALLRADDLCRLTPEGQAALVEYGVRTVVDLRSSGELAVTPHPFAGGAPSGAGLRYLSLPVFDDGDAEAMAEMEATAESVQELYTMFLESFGERFAAIMTAIAEAPEGGVLVHCFAGKDRTGLVIAMLLDLAGVPQATIAEDYALSDSYLQPLYEQMLAEIADLDERERAARTFNARPETMLAVLTYLDTRYGGVRSFLERAGVSHEDMDRLRDRLRAASRQL